MKGGKPPLGYTIVEVMIVLGVSGLMFLIAATFISGKQARTSFEQGVNELASLIQGTVSDVTDGHYSDVPFTCTQNLDDSLTITGTVTDQGTNSKCVYLGKLFHFSLDGEPTKYEVFSLAAARQKYNGTIIDKLADAHVTPVPFLTTSSTTPQTLEIEGMDVVDESGTDDHGKFSFGFIQGLGSTSNDVGTYDTGVQAVGLAYAPAITGNKANGDAMAAIVTNVQYAQKIVICLTDGARFAHLTIGGKASAGDTSNKLAVDTKLGDTAKVCT